MPSAAHSAAKKRVRDLHEDAAAVAHLGVGADRAAMVEVLEDREALLDDGVALAVLHVGDEADAAGILFVCRIVEALGRRQAGIAHRADRVRRGRSVAGMPAGTSGLASGSRRSCSSSHPLGRQGFAVGFRAAGGATARMPAALRVLSRVGVLLWRAPAPRGRPGLAISREAPVPPAFCGRGVIVSRLVRTQRNIKQTSGAAGLRTDGSAEIGTASLS